MAGKGNLKVKTTTAENNLKVLFPEIAADWHPTKNGDLKPEHVLPGSGKYAWWQCKNGHEWRAMIVQRRDGTGCPYCIHKKASKEYNLAVYNPEVAKQWHPTKNGKLTPEQVTPLSSRKVWWICARGHEWQAQLQSRTKGSGCPYCSGLYPSKTNNLNVHKPLLASQWHPFKNGKLKPEHVCVNSRLIVWWRCAKGHEWQSRISNRTDNNTWCPYCSRRKVTGENNLAKVDPEIAAQWHPTKNLPLTPDQVTCFSSKKVWWRCQYGHEWQALIRLRVKGADCPYCYGRYPSSDYNLQKMHPQLAAQWHPVKNGGLKPEDFAPGSGKTVWWLCEKGHEWKAAICHRKRTGCPVCGLSKAKEKRGLISLLKGFPDLAEEWHPKKNKKLTPADVSTGSNIKAWWVCEMGHSWKASVKKRVKGTGCPYCSGRLPSRENNLAAVNPELAAQWHPTKNGKLTPRKVTPASHKKVWWQCEKGHSWEAAVLWRKNGNNCPYCAKLRRKKNRMLP